MGTNRVFDNINGINQFLQKAKVWIEPGIDYDFKIKIGENLSTKVWINEAGAEDENLVIDKGATYPAYVPVAGDKITSENSQVTALNSERGNFGIGVIQTKGYEWTVKDTFVRSHIQTFPMHLFQFKVNEENWSSLTGPFKINYYGVGFDENGGSRAQLAI